LGEEIQKEREHQKYLDVGGRIILKPFSERKNRVAWTGLI
jgi:hypothetical protein